MRRRVACIVRLLGGHVFGSAESRAGSSHGQIGFDKPDQTEVGQLHDSIPTDEHIRRLHVAMNDAAIVRVSKGCGTDKSDVQRVSDRQTSHPVEPSLQRVATNKFHCGEQDAPLLAELKQTDNMRMVQHGERLSLPMKPLNQRHILSQLARQNLERDGSAETCLGRSINLPHRTLAEL